MLFRNRTVHPSIGRSGVYRFALLPLELSPFVLFMGVACIMSCALGHPRKSAQSLPNPATSTILLDTLPLLCWDSIGLERPVLFQAFTEKSIVEGKLFYLRDDVPGGRVWIDLNNGPRLLRAIHPAEVPMGYRRLIDRHHIEPYEYDSLFMANKELASYKEPRLAKIIERQGRVYELIRIYTYDLYVPENSLLVASFEFLTVDDQNTFFLDQRELEKNGISYYPDLFEMQEGDCVVPVRKAGPLSSIDRPMFVTFHQGMDSAYVPTVISATQLPKFYDEVGQGYLNSSGPIHDNRMITKNAPVVYSTDHDHYDDWSQRIIGEDATHALFSQGKDFFLSDFRSINDTLILAYHSPDAAFLVAIAVNSGAVCFKKRLIPLPQADSMTFPSDHEIVGLSQNGMTVLRWHF